MTHTDHQSEEVFGSQEAFEQLVKERLRYAVRTALISVLEEEVTAFIGAKPYERSEMRCDQRNGHDTRDLETTIEPIEDLPVPQTRKDTTRSSFNAPIAVATSWIAPLERCLSKGQHQQRRGSHGDSDRFASQRLQCLACVSYARS